VRAGRDEKRKFCLSVSPFTAGAYGMSRKKNEKKRKEQRRILGLFATKYTKKHWALRRSVVIFGHLVAEDWVFGLKDSGEK
jgi:hypothetical protein